MIPSAHLKHSRTCCCRWLHNQKWKTHPHWQNPHCHLAVWEDLWKEHNPGNPGRDSTAVALEQSCKDSWKCFVVKGLLKALLLILSGNWIRSIKSTTSVQFSCYTKASFAFINKWNWYLSTCQKPLYFCKGVSKYSIGQLRSNRKCCVM